MLIIKDLILVALFLYLIIRNISLYMSLIRQRNYFINTLSHDLRVSALAQIRGLEFLQKNPHYIRNNKDLLADINNSCKFSLDMMTMLLNTYKFENGEQVLHYEPVSMLEILDKILSENNVEAENKKIRINHKSLSESKVLVYKFYIEKLFKILISTAIANAYKNSNIEVFLSSNFEKKIYIKKYNNNYNSFVFEIPQNKQKYTKKALLTSKFEQTELC